jgi:dTDP-glucose 4,6-dehydratase
MRVLVTGGAGFIGSHLCDALIARGDTVLCVDNLSTGRFSNIAHLAGRPGFQFAEADVAAGIDACGTVDAVAHLASPASPPRVPMPPARDPGGGQQGNGARAADGAAGS